VKYQPLFNAFFVAIMFAFDALVAFWALKIHWEESEDKNAKEEQKKTQHPKPTNPKKAKTKKLIISLFIVFFCSSVMSTYDSNPALQNLVNDFLIAIGIRERKPPDDDESVPITETIDVPPQLLLLDDTDIHKGSFLSPEDADSKLQSEIKKIRSHSDDLLTKLDSIALLQLRDSPFKTHYDNFRYTRDPGDKIDFAQGLSDELIKFAQKNLEPSSAEFADYYFLSAGLALYALSCTDDFEKSPLAQQAKNRLWTAFEGIALKVEGIRGLPEEYIFYIQAASISHMRLQGSYDGEPKKKREKDLRDCRILHIKIMRFADNLGEDVAHEYALRAQALTDYAYREGIVLPGDSAARKREDTEVQDFLKKHQENATQIESSSNPLNKR